MAARYLVKVRIGPLPKFRFPELGELFLFQIEAVAFEPEPFTGVIAFSQFHEIRAEFTQSAPIVSLQFLGGQDKFNNIPGDMEIALPDATPEIVLEYAGGDEQGILAKLRYNRMLDIFLGITCYHLQNHLRTSIKDKGQVEIDDLYVALNSAGKQFVIPIEAKSAKDHISKTQIMQGIDFARDRYPKLILRPVGIQEMKDGSLVLIEFTAGSHPDKIKIVEMRRYKLVPMSEVPLDELQTRV